MNGCEYALRISDDVLKNGLTKDNLQLQLRNGVLTLVIDGYEIVLSTNANNMNISGQVDLGDGYCLIFDIKGNGSTVKVFDIMRIRTHY